MKPFTECRIFSYLTLTPHQGHAVSAEEISSSYAEYEQYLNGLAAEPLSISERLRHLLHGQVELVSLKKLSVETEQPCDTPTGFYLDKCLLLVEAEIELLKFSVQHPAAIETSPSFLSSLHWKGTLVNLMELISSLDYSELVTDESGKRLSFAGIVFAFEKLFNVSIPKPYDLRADLARRKKNYSVLLPKLKETFEKNIVKCGIESK
ncbi:RteC domain-containing protein [Bacteroides intestinalis]|uniref:RteC domain-containing protein n=1 Tax=Bacteroides intestinalis TaxID=329854 RepID=UPI0018A0BCF3|nr:RteC domain-containing protein [Bacteroides intestinalis]